MAEQTMNINTYGSSTAQAIGSQINLYFGEERLKCPRCGGEVALKQAACPFCGEPYLARTASELRELNVAELQKYVEMLCQSRQNKPNRPRLLIAHGLCQMERRMFAQAADTFRKLASSAPDFADAYYYAALSAFEGKRPFLSSLKVVRYAENALQTALSFGEDGRCYYLLGMIRRDFYERKCLRAQYLPFMRSSDFWKKADACGVSQEDAAILRKYISIPKEG